MNDCEHFHPFLNCRAERIIRKHKEDTDTIERKLIKYGFDLETCMKCDKFKEHKDWKRK